MKAKTFRIVTFSVVGVLLALILAVNVAAALFQDIIMDLFSTSEVSSAARAAGEDLALQIQEEGSVLVKNDENTLPLNAETDTQLNVFGWSAISWIAAGSGSGRSLRPGINGDTADNARKGMTPETDFLTALSEAKISYNQDLITMYKRFASQRPAQFYDTLHSFDYQGARLIEPSIDDTNYYSTELLSGAEAYSKIAIVVLGRSVGESNDAPLVQYKGASSNKTPDDADRTYLEISTEEEALLKYVGDNYEKTIVLINSTNAMNLGFMDRIEGLDSCLVVGGTGMNAVRGVVNLLYGQKMFETKESVDESGKTVEIPDPLYGTKISPSGRLTDTYVYDFATNPAWAYTGTQGVGKYTNDGGAYPHDGSTRNVNVGTNPLYEQVSYLDYQENIYVGYKWYETAFADGFWDSDFAKNNFGIQNGYKDVVQYPFGYGLSYTTFKWDHVKKPSITSVSASDKDDLQKELEVTVDVTNLGDIPGQEVVELYYTPPYTKGGVEKSAVNLLAFAKTQTAVLVKDENNPNQNTQTLTLKFKIADMASYDAYNRSGLVPNGGWILEKGDYVLSLRTDAHTVADMDDATFTIRVTEDIPYCDGGDAYNAFTGDDAVDFGISVDGLNSDNDIEYLSRGTGFAEFKLVPKGQDRTVSWMSRGMSQKLRDTNLYDSADISEWEEKNSDVEMPVFGQDSGSYKLFAGMKNGELDLSTAGSSATDDGLLLGMDYDSPLWEDVLDSITVKEMVDLTTDGFNRENAVKSVNKALTSAYDGPSQIGSFNTSEHGTGFPMPTVIAQTWNDQIAKSFGYSTGSQALTMGISGWYAPGMNLHRSAFGGRNYEYYSEDPLLSGVMGCMTAEGSLNAGVYVYVKHIIGYDQETLRDGLYCWMTEQALREIYLKPFKYMIDRTQEDIGGTPGLMTSYGRIGATWSGGSEALITQILRNEWHYNGTILTDYSDHTAFMNGDQMIRAGGDLWMSGWQHNATYSASTDSAACRAQLREATHHILYTILNAQAVASAYVPENDQLQSGRTERAEFPLWTIIGVVDAVVIAGCAVWVFFAIRKKDKAAAPAGPQGAGAEAESGEAAGTSAPFEEQPPEETNHDE